MKRGEIWVANLEPPANRRPVLILSRNTMPAARPEITVAYLTTKSRKSPAEVRVTAIDDGVEKDSFVNLDSVNTVSKDRLFHFQCTLSAAKMIEVANAG